jgi:hypothetical protein
MIGVQRRKIEYGVSGKHQSEGVRHHMLPSAALYNRPAVVGLFFLRICEVDLKSCVAEAIQMGSAPPLAVCVSIYFNDLSVDTVSLTVNEGI